MFDPHSKPHHGWKRRAYSIIFEDDTRLGLFFDVALLVAILASIVVVMLGTVQWAEDSYGELLSVIELVLTALFSAEYLLRLIVVRKASRYAFSLMGVVDLLSILPTYLAVFMVENATGLSVLRSLRLFRVFRLFQLGPFVRESNTMLRALTAARFKIVVFLGALLIVVTVQGAILYFVEPKTFGNLPQAVYWSIVTLTTVGYGDISPQTGIGQGIAAMLMLMGYGVIAVPTGIVSVEMARSNQARMSTATGEKQDGEGMEDTKGEAKAVKVCFVCRRQESEAEAEYCKYCGDSLQWLDP